MCSLACSRSRFHAAVLWNFLHFLRDDKNFFPCEQHKKLVVLAVARMKIQNGLKALHTQHPKKWIEKITKKNIDIESSSINEF